MILSQFVKPTDLLENYRNPVFGEVPVIKDFVMVSVRVG